MSCEFADTLIHLFRDASRWTGALRTSRHTDRIRRALHPCTRNVWRTQPGTDWAMVSSAATSISSISDKRTGLESIDEYLIRQRTFVGPEVHLDSDDARIAIQVQGLIDGDERGLA